MEHTPSTPVTDWVVDSDASNHTTQYPHSISPPRPPLAFYPRSIVVGNGSILPVTSIGDLVLPGPMVPPVAPPYPSSVAGNSETVVVLHTALVSPPAPFVVPMPLPAPFVVPMSSSALRAALVSCLCPTPLMY
jgi:hypothetical protein